MTEEKINKITAAVRDATFNFLEKDKYELLNLVVSLHNELYNEVKGRYYDYSYHWANLGYGGEPIDSLFKEAENE